MSSKEETPLSTLLSVPPTMSPAKLAKAEICATTRKIEIIMEKTKDIINPNIAALPQSRPLFGVFLLRTQNRIAPTKGKNNDKKFSPMLLTSSMF